MRISELSRRSEVGISTIKFYLRSGLLHAGERTGPNQTRYDESHVRRLRVIRALIDVGGLSLASVAELTGDPDGRGPRPPRVPGADSWRSCAAGVVGDEESRARWRRRLVAAFEARGWRVDAVHADVDDLVSVLVAMEVAGLPPDDGVLAAYLRAGGIVAEAEADQIANAGATAECAERAVVSIALGAAALVAVRRLAHDAIRVDRDPP
ncbi:MerR family transcriptional regulator [Saccharothrix yanglingensis]|uniref:MerR family transcriptional regulator n=1 Tax=Saccharothrix yanglingensis TaxID=659496 RepID=UPI0027D207A0|nr:MerR family transcriptional regulator [Saccharothrix yanglingensis]